MAKLFSKNTLLLLFVVIVGFLLRLYKIENPIADWHSWRQVDTSAVSRTFVTNGFDILHPRFEDISNVPSGKDNPEGYRFVEFPLYNIFQAGFYTIFDTFSLEVWGRLVTICSSLLAGIFLYVLVKRHSDELTALCVSIVYLTLPFNVYFGRTVLPDPSMIMTILAGIYFFDNYVEKTNKKKALYYMLAVVFTASSFLLKPYALFFTLPMFYLVIKKYPRSFFKQWQLWLFIFLTVFPLLGWRQWISQFPEGIPASDWLFNAGNIRFTGAYFYWIFADRIARLILGYWGITFFIFGILFGKTVLKEKKDFGFFISFIFSSLLYLIIIARGNVQHDYYQIAIVPSLSIFTGLGLRFLINNSLHELDKKITITAVTILLLFMYMFSWYFVRDYYNINNKSIIIAGAAVDEKTPKNAKVVAPYDGDTTLLYYTYRQGWASFQNPLPELIQKGATHLVLINPSEKDREIGKTYKIIADTKEYILFDLRKSP